LTSILSSRPSGPDPKEEGAIFLGWLKKRGAIRNVKDCERRCQESTFHAKTFVREIGSEYIGLYSIGREGKVIKLEDKVWADNWMIYYGVEVPHHRHTMKLKK